MAKTDYNDIDIMMNVLVKRTEELVNDAYRCHKEEDPKGTSNITSLVFPKYSADEDESQDKQKKKNKTRISEQELRFAFVQAFHEYKCTHNCNYQYGVEVPTKDKYLFTKVEKDGNGEDKRRYEPEINKEKGRSGSFDMVIYNEKLERVCLIEFKYGNPEKGSFAKDFLKLANQKEGKEGTKCYFIHLTKDKANNEEKLRSDIQKLLTIGIEKIIYKSVILISK